MPISGLVITASQPQDVAVILDAFKASMNGGPVGGPANGIVIEGELIEGASIQIGTPFETRIPFVTETPDKEADKRLWDWLWNLPGVAKLDVAFIHLNEGDAGDAVTPVTEIEKQPEPARKHSIPTAL